MANPMVLLISGKMWATDVCEDLANVGRHARN